MEKKNKKIVFVFLVVLFVIYNLTLLSLYRHLQKFQTKEEILGTFITEDNQLADAQYFVVDQSGKAYWYKQQDFYKEGKIERLNDKNVYEATFGEDHITIVYYEEQLIFIHDNLAIEYERINEVPEYIGVEDIELYKNE